MKQATPTIAVVLGLLLVGLNVLAMPQGVEPTRVSSPTPRYPSSTAYFKCTVSEVLAGHVLIVKDEQTRSFRFLELKPTTSLKAKKKSDLGGRKKLDPSRSPRTRCIQESGRTRP